MVWVPAIYFTTFFLLVLKKKGFGFNAYLVLPFVVSSICSVLSVNLKLMPNEYCSPGLIPTIVFCGLITTVLYPVSKLDISSFGKVTVHNVKAVEWLVYISFSLFVIYLIWNLDNIIFRLLFGDFGELRLMQAQGIEITAYKKLGPSYFAYIFGVFSIVMIPIFFISITQLNKKWWFNLMAILGSLTTILLGIMNIDRSQTFYYLLVLGMCWLIFEPQMSENIRRKTKVALIVIASLAVFYIMLVSIGRFEDTNDLGTRGGLIDYAGKSFLNFCYFWDNYYNPDWLSDCTIPYFPVIRGWIIKDYHSLVSLGDEFFSKTGFEINTFSSLLGSFLYTGNHLSPFIFCILYSLSIRYCRSKCLNRFGLTEFLLLFIFLLVPLLGCFDYYFLSPNVALTAWSVLLLSKILKA